MSGLFARFQRETNLISAFTIYLKIEKPLFNTEMIFSINLIGPDSSGSPIRLMMDAILAFDLDFLG